MPFSGKSREGKMTPTGTAFVIRADEHHCVLGQVIADHNRAGPQLLAAFRGIHPVSSMLKSEFVLPLLEQKPLILADSFDILISNQDWQTLGIFPIAGANRVFPKFKVPSAIPFFVSVETYDRKRCYPTLPFLARRVPLRFTISAKLFESLALAANGRGEWNKKYDRVLFDGMTVSRLMDTI